MSKQTALGPFTREDRYWESEPILVPLFGEAEVRILSFSESEDPKDILAADEIDALQRFLSLPESRAAEIVPHLWRNYQDMWEAVGPPDILEISDPATIWRHVQPRSVTVDRDEHGAVYVSVEAECDWEIEHGLQLVLQHGDRWVRVSDFSGHLTDGRAWGMRSLDDWMADPAKTLPVRGREELLAAKREG